MKLRELAPKVPPSGTQRFHPIEGLTDGLRFGCERQGLLESFPMLWFYDTGLDRYKQSSSAFRNQAQPLLYK